MKRDLFLFPKIKQIQSIQQLRERLLNILLVTSTLAGGVVYISAIIQVFQEGLARMIPAYTVLYLILVATAFVKKLGYRLRAGILLLLIYIPAVFNLYLNGLNVDSGLFFLTLVVMTFLLVGFWSGLLAIGLSLLTIMVMGILVVQGVMVPVMNPPQPDQMLWIVGGLVFALTSAILIISYDFLVTGLESQLTHTQELLAEIQQAKRELEGKDRRFTTLLQGSTDMIVLLDKDGTILYASPSIERILGYQPDEILGQRVYDYLHPEDLPAAARAMTPGVPPEEIGPYLELRIHHRDGTWRVVEVVGEDVYEDPAVNGTVINCRDITDRKRIENELRATQQELELLVTQQQHEIDTYSERLAQMIRHSPVVIYGYGYSEPIKPPFISENILQLTGYEAQEFIQDTHQWNRYIHPEDIERANRNFRSELEQRGSAVREYRFLHKDGRYLWFREEARRIMEDAQPELEFVGLVVDITAQKQSEAAYASLVESSLQGVLLSQDGRVVFANQALCDFIGLSLQEVLDLTTEHAIQHLHPDDLYKFDNIQRALGIFSEQAITPAQFEVRWIRRGEDVRWLDVYINRLEFRGRTAYQVTTLDITERKQAELDLLESEKINRLLLESTTDSIILVNPDGIILACNEITAQRFGHPMDQLKGCCLHDLVSPTVTTLRKQKLEEVVRSGKPLSFEDRREEHWYLHNLYPIFDERHSISQVAIFATDITHRKEMEEELRLQKENLEVQVAERTRELRVLSHELIRAQEAERHQVSRELHDEAGQLMVELSLSLDAAYDELPKEQRPIRKRLKVVRELVSRVTKSIRSLARSLRPPALEVAGINTVLEDLCEEYSNFSQMPVSYHGQEIELPDVVSISLYRFVQETLTNVVKHARASLAEVRLETLDGDVCLTVSDNGKGMHPARPSGGLGLLGIQERAALLGGRVDIQSSQSGTSVKICVPMELSGKVVLGMSSQKGQE